MNYFDQAADLESGLGFLKKVRKTLSSVNSKVNNVRSKVASKILPSKVREIGRKIDDNRDKIAIVAGGAALAFAGGPAIVAGLKGAGGLVAKGGAMVKAGASTALASTTGKALTGAATTMVTNQMTGATAPFVPPETEQAAQEATERAFQVEQQLAQAMGQSPEFRQSVAQYRREGYSDEEILRYWMESKAYYLAATKEAAQVVYPQVLKTVEQMGFPHHDARDIAYSESYRVAGEEVKKVQETAKNSGGANLVLPAAIAAIFFMLG